MPNLSIRRRTFLSFLSVLPFAPRLARAETQEPAERATSANHVVFDAPRLDGVTLLGMSEPEALERILAPVRMQSSGPNRSAYLCGDPHIRVIEFDGGRLVEYQVAPHCRARTVRGVSTGDPLQHVVERYGALRSPRDRARSSAASGAWFAERHRHSRVRDRVWVSYPRDGVVFQFGPDRCVRSIAVQRRSTVSA
ncbi:MAG: hypothetical protein ACKVWV_11040 [Planctomycetota bacterium]